MVNEREGWGEYIIHYDDDTYQYCIPCYVELESMYADFPNGHIGEYWSPSKPPDDMDWNDSFEDVEFDGRTYPVYAVQSSYSETPQELDPDGYNHMIDRYGSDGFITVILPPDW